MTFDLNSLLTEIHSWKSVIQHKDAEIEIFKSKIKKADESIETLDNSNRSLLKEIAHFNNIISSLQQSLSKLKQHEGEKKTLIEENMNLKNCLAEQEMLHQVQLVELRESMENLNLVLKEEYEKKLSETEAEVSLKLQSYSTKLREKENHILELEDRLSQLHNENTQDILKIKLEYEEKIKRFKCKTAKNKELLYSSDFKKTHIFRQKYIEKEREAREETSKLQRQIEDLQKEIALLKNTNVTNNADFSNDELMCLETSLHPAKRPKLIDCSDDDFESLNAVSRNFHKQSSDTVHHFKKKLFNLDMNYFDK